MFKEEEEIRNKVNVKMQELLNLVIIRYVVAEACMVPEWQRACHAGEEKQESRQA